jgi:hypothetical protein
MGPRDVSVLGRTPEAAPTADEGIRRVEPQPPPSGYEGVGEHVAGVLRAAEEAADAMRRRAQEEAEELLGAARRKRNEADDYASDVRSAVETYASQQRKQAEEEARQTLAAAQAEARAVREAAQAMAARLEEESRRRRDETLEETRAIEERHRRAFEHLRDVVGQIEDILRGVPEARDGEERSLVEALSFKRRR